MLVATVRARLVSGRQPIVDVPPVIRRRVRGFDAKRLDRVDRLQNMASKTAVCG